MATLRIEFPRYVVRTGSGVPGGGDVTGPESATADAIPRFADTTGKLMEESGAKVNDDGHIITPGLILSGPDGILWRLTLGPDNPNGSINQQWEKLA